MSIKDLKSNFFKNLKNYSKTNSFWMEKLKTDPMLQNAMFTIDLIFGNGKVIRGSLQNLSITKDNQPITYLPIIQNEIEISSTFNFGDGAGSQRSFVFTIDGRLINPMEIILNGDFLSGIGQLCLQYPNSNYNQRIILLTGVMSGGITFGTNRELLEIELSDPKETNDKIIPEYFLTIEDYPALPDNEKGKRIPLVFNGNTCGIPCIKTSETKYAPTFVVCYKWDFEIDKVYVDGVETSSTDPTFGWSQINTKTDRNLLITTILFISAGDVWEDKQTVYVTLKRSDKIKPLSILELIKNLLINFTDFGSEGFNFDVYGKSISRSPKLYCNILINGSDQDNTATTISFISSTIGDAFPMITLCYSDNGIAPLFVDRRSTNIILDITVGQNWIFDRNSSLKESPIEELYNSFTLKYDYDAVNDNYKKVITVDATNNVFCKISESRIGKKEKKPIETVIIQDDRTAGFIMNWMTDHLTLPSYQIEYIGVPELFFKLNIGDNITITDSELGLSKEKGIVEQISITNGRVLLKVRMWILYSKLSAGHVQN